MCGSRSHPRIPRIYSWEYVNQNEALVDWIALQFPKMMKVMMQGKAFDDKEIKDAFAAYESVNRQA